ncbi:MAG: hypothetical protein LBL42_02170 [Tannerella sp.]|jgi:hypothetical protein|nr:hypothetical protein [Tannerella sp.]
MVQRDFIMVQIEELGKVMAQLISRRETGATRQIPEQIQTVYRSLKLNRDFLMTAAPEDIVQALDGDDRGGMLRMDIAARALIEESYLFSGRQQQDMLLKAQTLLEYLQTHDRTFSLERLALLDDLRRRKE